MNGPLPIGPLTAKPEAATPTPAPTKEASPELVAAAREFESLLMNMMLKSMRSTVERSDLFGDTKHIETYEQLLDQEYAQGMAEQGGFGFADLIVKQFTDAGQGVTELRQAATQMRAARDGYEAYGDAAAAGSIPVTGVDR